MAAQAADARAVLALGDGTRRFRSGVPSKPATRALPRILHPHQLPLAIWVEMGILGLLAEVMLLAASSSRGDVSGCANIPASVRPCLPRSWRWSFRACSSTTFFEYLWLFPALLAAVSSGKGMREVPERRIIRRSSQRSAGSGGFRLRSWWPRESLPRSSSAHPTPLYEGRAIVIIDSATLSKFPDLPRADDMLREIEKPEFVSQVASEALVPSETVAAELSAYTREDPQRQLVLTFHSPSESEASSVTVIAATAAAKQAGRLGGHEDLRVAAPGRRDPAARGRLSASMRTPVATGPHRSSG